LIEYLAVYQAKLKEYLPKETRLALSGIRLMNFQSPLFILGAKHSPLLQILAETGYQDFRSNGRIRVYWNNGGGQGAFREDGCQCQINAAVRTLASLRVDGVTAARTGNFGWHGIHTLQQSSYPNHIP
jgi:hypothetical protein